MRTLFFTVRKTKPYGNPSLSISTHYGSRITVEPDFNVPVPVLENDKMSDGELLNWYNSRYSRMGLLTSIKHSGEPKLNDVPVKEIEKKMVVEVPDLSTVTPLNEAPDQCEACKIEVQDESKLSESVESSESTTVAKSGVIVDGMSYPEMIKFCKEHSIEVSGRAKELYVKAINDFLNK